MSSLSAVSGEFLGAVAALGAGLAWALGSILFRRLADLTSPLGLNLAKGLLGLVYLGASLLWVGTTPIDGRTALYLSISGIVGIALGDTLFFMALVRLEPRKTVLLATIGQAMTVVLALSVLNERPSALAWGGIVAIVAGVTWVMRERTESDGTAQNQRSGILYGLGAALCMSVGIIFAKLGLNECSALQATTIRLGAGMGLLILIGLVRGQIVDWLRPFADRKRFIELAWADVVIVVGGFYLSMLALELTDATIVSVLTSTEPLFILPLAAWLLRERISTRAVLGALVATGGVAAILASIP